MQGFTFAVVLEQGVKISLRLLCFRKRRPEIAYVYNGFGAGGQNKLTFTVFFVIS